MFKMFESSSKIKMEVIVNDKISISDKAAANRLIGAIDQGTSSSKFLVFTPKGEVLAKAQIEHKQIFPQGEDKVGWHEHDPLELWINTVSCIKSAAKALRDKKGLDLNKALAGVGITNQRETTVAWNADTGVPYYNAIVWDDTRTTELADSLGHKDCLRDKTGLPLASYFAGTKVKWLVDNVPALQEDLKNKPDQVRFGTIDTWLMYQLTGTLSTAKGAANVGGSFVTDVSNASRWLFMNIHTMKWDADLISHVCGTDTKIPLSALPEICPSSHVYGVCKKSNGIDVLDNVSLASILGDQQAALFGHGAFEAGRAKNTYGTGMFLMMHTGTERVASTHGLLTTVAYQLGDNGPVQYALEGSVSHSGSTIQWLRDKLEIINNAADSEKLASDNNDGMYFVPAFAGLFAPHWRSDARACMVGLTATHHKGHICRAALEAAAYQAKEVFDAMLADYCNGRQQQQQMLSTLHVDGGATANRLLMQFQADMLQVPVVKPVMMETTSMGAAFAAGLATGVWKSLPDIQAMLKEEETFKPKMAEDERAKNWVGWQKAVQKSLHWHEVVPPSPSSAANNNENVPGVETKDAVAVVETKDAAPEKVQDTTRVESKSPDEEKKQPVDDKANLHLPTTSKPSSTEQEQESAEILAMKKAMPMAVVGSCALAAGFLLGRIKR